MLIDLNGNNKDPNPVYAERSAYNWPLAIYSEILNHYGQDHENWTSQLITNFSSVTPKPLKSVPERKIFQNIFHGINLALSIKLKYEKQHFFHADIVGTISDFYYALYNLFSSISMAMDIPQNESHAKNINIFNSLRSDLPYPFNIHSDFDSSNWNGTNLINLKNFLYVLPNIKSTNSPTASEINKIQSGNVLSPSVAQDILLGYLRGTVDYNLWQKSNKYKAKNNITTWNKHHKSQINPQLRGINIGFMNCLYRYRTKAHYRDFSFLTYDFTDDRGDTNAYMDINYYRCLCTIVEFAVATSVAHASKRIGKNKTKSYIEDISAAIKDRQNISSNYWELFI